jgi:hypothetical protein
MKTQSPPYVELRKSSIHNTGVFAIKDIPKGTKVIQYMGERIAKKESERRYERTLSEHKNNSSENGAVYIFELDDRFDLDGNVPYNTAKYINHSCDPNCEAINIDGEIWICAIRDIRKGEELSYNYGYSLDDFEEHPCHCGSHNCIGYIIAKEYWPKAKGILNKKKKGE